MAITPSQIQFSVGGVGTAVTLPNTAWADELAPLYREFPLSGAVDWHVTLRYDPTLPPAEPRWIRHEGDFTRFHLISIAGEVDFASQEVEVTIARPDLAASALERAAAYGVMHTLLHRHNSLLLHAAGIHWQGLGILATGHSGAGKTTLTRLALGYGEPFNDEMVIADLSGPQPLLRSTPFLGFGTPPELRTRVNRVYPISLLLFLAHGPDFALQPLASSEAIWELLRTGIAAVDRPANSAHWMALAGQLLQRVPVYRLAFRPTTDVWAFLAHALEEPSCVS